MADEDNSIEFKKTVTVDGCTVYQSCSEAEWLVYVISGAADDIFVEKHEPRHRSSSQVHAHDPPAQAPMPLPRLDASEA